MKWKKLKPVTPAHTCLSCPPKPETLRMSGIIAVGFGYAAITRDGKEIWTERPKDKHFRKVWWAEKKAAADPRHDWRIIMDGPLNGSTWQRQGPKTWICVKTNLGFA